MPKGPVPSTSAVGPIRDTRVLRVLERMNASRRHPERAAFEGPSRHDPAQFAEYGFSIHPDQGNLIYLLCRGMKARRVIDFATSIGTELCQVARRRR